MITAHDISMFALPDANAVIKRMDLEAFRRRHIRFMSDLYTQGLPVYQLPITYGNWIPVTGLSDHEIRCLPDTYLRELREAARDRVHRSCDVDFAGAEVTHV